MINAEQRQPSEKNLDSSGKTVVAKNTDVLERHPKQSLSSKELIHELCELVGLEPKRNFDIVITIINLMKRVIYILNKPKGTSSAEILAKKVAARCNSIIVVFNKLSHSHKKLSVRVSAIETNSISREERLLRIENALAKFADELSLNTMENQVHLMDVPYTTEEEVEQTIEQESPLINPAVRERPASTNRHEPEPKPEPKPEEEPSLESLRNHLQQLEERSLQLDQEIIEISFGQTDLEESERLTREKNEERLEIGKEAHLIRAEIEIFEYMETERTLQNLVDEAVRSLEELEAKKEELQKGLEDGTICVKDDSSLKQKGVIANGIQKTKTQLQARKKALSNHLKTRPGGISSATKDEVQEFISALDREREVIFDFRRPPKPVPNQPDTIAAIPELSNLKTLGTSKKSEKFSVAFRNINQELLALNEFVLGLTFRPNEADKRSEFIRALIYTLQGAIGDLEAMVSNKSFPPRTVTEALGIISEKLFRITRNTAANFQVQKKLPQLQADLDNISERMLKLVFRSSVVSSLHKSLEDDSDSLV